MVPFAGYEMPVQYTGVLEEAKQVRASAGLFDVSHMGQLSVRGSDPVAALNGLLTNDLSKVALGQAQYSMVCNPKGGVIDDIIAYRRKPDEVFLCVNASNRHTVFAWLADHLPKSVSIEDQSDALCLLAVQGPLAEKLLCECSDPTLVKNLAYYWAAEAKVFGVPCYLSRTGYTGEDGFEIYVSNSEAPGIWEKLMEIGAPKGLGPIGLGARDTLRLEMGYPLHGHEISPEINPLEAALQWVVKLKKEAFIGKQALENIAASGPGRLLRGFAIEDRRMARAGARILSRTKQPAGIITSGTFSPHLHHPIALGLVDSKFSGEKDFLLEVRQDLVSMHVHPLPFVSSHTKKKA